MRTLLFTLLVLISFQVVANTPDATLSRKKREIPEEILQSENHYVTPIFTDPEILAPEIYTINLLSRPEGSFQFAEANLIKECQSNMHYRLFHDASYSFSDLAHVYMQHSRFSEAKWYLLQSMAISKQQHDDKHTISNLIDLAMVKANFGDLVQANQDLSEARGLAKAKGFDDDFVEIEQLMDHINKIKV
jgi:hypothetical protein